MKKTYLILLMLLSFSYTHAQVAINTTGEDPDPSAILDIKSTGKGMLIPRMTADQRDSIPSPAQGLTVFVKDDNHFWYFDGTSWVIAAADNLGNHKATENIQTQGHWISYDGDDEGIYVDTSGFVGIKQSAPLYELDVNGTIRHGKYLRVYSSNNPEGFKWIHFVEADNTYGDNVYISVGGTTAIGGGESVIRLKNNINNGPGYERLYLTSDVGSSATAIQMITGLQNSWDDRVYAMTVTGEGNIGIGTTQPYGLIHIIHKYDAGANSSSHKADLMIGDPLDKHVEFDNNEIIAMNDTSEVGTLYVHPDGGRISIFQNENGNMSINNGGYEYALNLPNVDSTAIGWGRAYAWGTYSDARIKSQVQPIQNALTTVLHLRPKHYFQHNSEFIHGDENNPQITGLRILPQGRYTTGFIAQELYEVMPDAVYKPANEQTDLWSIDYQKLIPVLTAAIQEQQAQIEQLKREVEELRARLGN